MEGPDREAFRVNGLDLIEPAFASFDGAMFAGRLPAFSGQLMFWLFVPSQPKDSWTVWLNGGPGCSSMAGNLFENGPVTAPLFPAGFCCSDASPSFVVNRYSWTKATTMLYVEQPVGTGFSSVSNNKNSPKTEEDVARDFYHFLQKFCKVFQEFQSKRLFIFGESYAGMYVPSIARKVFLEQKKHDQVIIKLAGIGLGNGWMDATIQGPIMIDYAWYHGMIDGSAQRALHDEWRSCLEHNKQKPPFHSFTTPDECGIMGAILEASGSGIFLNKSPNTYDVTTWDTYSALFDRNGTFSRFFNNHNVKKALHAPDDVVWSVCIPGEGRRLHEKENETAGDLLLDHDRPISVIPYLAELLDDAEIRVLVYNGDRDMSCCAQGAELCLDSLEWSGREGWQNAPRRLWTVNGDVAGYSKSFGNLDFVVVYNSGHLVPFNQPVHALDLFTRFLAEESFGDVVLPSFHVDESVHTTGSRHKGEHHVVFVAGFLGVVVGILLTVVVSWFQQRRSRYDRI